MTEFDDISYLKLSMFAREMGSSGLVRVGLISWCIVEIKIRAHDRAPSVFRRPLKFSRVLKPFCSATAV